MERKDAIIKIDTYPFMVKFVDKDSLYGCDGKAEPNGRIIYIRNDLDDIDTRITLIHELCHCFQFVQGRRFQRQFELEDVCEFIAYTHDKIEKLVNEVLL